MARLRGEKNFLKQVIFGQKIQNFMLISKILICLSDKMPPKRLKLKNLFKGLNLAVPIFCFLNFNFFGSILSLRYIYIFEKHKILDLFIPNITYFKEKKFSFQRTHFSNFWSKTPNKEEIAKSKDKYLFLNQSQKSFPNLKIPEALPTLKTIAP